MILKNKTVYVYDIEIFPNVFSCIIKNTETKEYYVFEISERVNNIQEVINFFSNCKDKLICGYNCLHYDNPIINYILDYKCLMVTLHYFRICDSLYNLSNIIIHSDSTDQWKKWKYTNNFDTLDLLAMLFSKDHRCGLKEMQVTMKYPNVQEYEGDFSQPLPSTEIDTMLKYNKNDVDSTEELLYRCEAQIQLRLDIEQEFGINVLSKDGMSIGNEILKLKYLEASGKTWYDIKDLRSPCDWIPLNRVILPIVHFQHPILQELLKEMRQQIVSPGRKGYEKHFLLDNVEVTVGVGGIHSKNNPEIIIPNTNQVLLDSDVALA